MFIFFENDKGFDKKVYYNFLNFFVFIYYEYFKCYKWIIILYVKKKKEKNYD